MNESFGEVKTPLVPAGQLRTLQIIAAALLMGVTTFFAIALFIRFGQANAQGLGAPGRLPVITYMACVFWLANLVLAALIPRIQTRTALRQIANGTWQPPGGTQVGGDSILHKLLMVRQTTLITSLAILEGGAFFACIAVIVEGQLLAIGVVVGSVLLMLAQFPTEQRIQRWLESQASGFADMRQIDSPPSA